MALTESDIQTKAWDVIRSILNSDNTVTSNSNKRYSAYPDTFLSDAGGLPIVVINKPEVVAAPLTLDGTKQYIVTFEIHSVVGGESRSAEKLKVLADAVRYALLNNQSITESNGLYNPVILSDTADFDFRGGKKIHYDILRIQYTYIG